jgi:putative PIN family toxin of toxin-antitoxin system
MLKSAPCEPNMRVVLDTNILVSSVLGGILRAIVDDWKAGKFTLIVSEAIAQEYLEILNRPKFKFSAQEIADIKGYLLKAADFVTPVEKVDVVKADPSDNKFLEAALAGRAIYVVSGDSHLLELKDFRGIEIITAREFLERLETL